MAVRLPARTGHRPSRPGARRRAVPGPGGAGAGPGRRPPAIAAALVGVAATAFEPVVGGWTGPSLAILLGGVVAAPIVVTGLTSDGRPPSGCPRLSPRSRRDVLAVAPGRSILDGPRPTEYRRLDGVCADSGDNY